MYRITVLQSEQAKAAAAIEEIDRVAAGEKRDLTADEKRRSDELLDRIAALKAEAEALAPRAAAIGAASTALLQLGQAAGQAGEPIDRAARLRSTETAPMTPGEYLASVAQLGAGAINMTEFVDRVGAYLDGDDIDRAQTLTTDTAGILPKPIIGPVLKLADPSRPVFSSMSSPIEMPELGKTFTRPRISQRAQVGEQLAEGTALSSRTLIVVGDDVTKRTVGGVLELSRQDIDWTSPAALDLLVKDFVDLYAEWTEAQAIAALVAGTTNTSVYTATNNGTIINSYVAAVQAAYGFAKRMPDTIWVGLDQWATLASTLTADGSRTLLMLLKEALSEMGVAPSWVVSPNFAAATRIIGNSGLTEAYERQNGLLSVDKVSTMVREIGYSGYVAFRVRAEHGVKLV